MGESQDAAVERTEVVVVGGGLAGLAAAATAARAGRAVVVLEGHRLGGRAQVDRRNGYTFNRGPRALYLAGAGHRVLGDLGVPLDGGHRPPLGGGMAARGAELHLLPTAGGSLLRTSLVPAAQKVRLAATLVRLPKVDPERVRGLSADAAVASLGLGPQSTETVRALVRLATYTAATDLLDGVAALRQLVAALEGVLYVDGGWATLVEGLRQVAVDAGAVVQVGDPVREVVDVDGEPLVVTSSGRRIRSDAVVVAAGGPDAASALLGEDVASASGAPLGPAASAACLELGLARIPAHRFVLGVDEPLYLSMHCPPADLAPPGGAVVHVMRYLRHDEDPAHDAVRAQLRAFAARAGVADGDVVEERFLARMTVTGAIPTAAEGLAGRAGVDVPGRRGVFLAGDWVGPEGLLADAALASGAAAGRRAAAASGRLAVA